MVRVEPFFVDVIKNVIKTWRKKKGARFLNLTP